MKSVAKFLWLDKAMAFCATYKHDNLHIERELDGYYHVYAMEVNDESE